MKVQLLRRLLLISIFFFSGIPASIAQTAQAPTEASKSRPESFEWDHQIELFDEAYYDGNYLEAERFARKSLEIAEQLHLGYAKRATSLSSLGGSLRYQKKYTTAEPLFREALAIREKILPPINFRTAYVLEGLAVSLVGQNRPGEAEPYYLRASAIWDRIDKEEYQSSHHGVVLDGLGRIYFQAGSYEKPSLFTNAHSTSGPRGGIIAR